ncbi:MAG: Methyltransferase type 12 [Mucilaginibacter sp.]|nr:Methyltransferase type 12 [Mucilaginibacter sp.]
MKNNKKAHWEHVYTNKTPDQVSWTQSVPQTSLDFIHGFQLPNLPVSLMLVVGTVTW